MQGTKKRREVNKWEVDEHKQWSENVKSHRFCPHMLDKNRNYEPVGMNGSNFKNDTLFVSFAAQHYSLRNLGE